MAFSGRRTLFPSLRRFSFQSLQSQWQSATGAFAKQVRMAHHWTPLPLQLWHCRSVAGYLPHVHQGMLARGAAADCAVPLRIATR